MAQKSFLNIKNPFSVAKVMIFFYWSLSDLCIIPSGMKVFVVIHKSMLNICENLESLIFFNSVSPDMDENMTSEFDENLIDDDDSKPQRYFFSPLFRFPHDGSIEVSCDSFSSDVSKFSFCCISLMPRLSIFVSFLLNYYCFALLVF